jgi:hypothetical protein
MVDVHCHIAIQDLYLHQVHAEVALSGSLMAMGELGGCWLNLYREASSEAPMVPQMVEINSAAAQPRFAVGGTSPVFRLI